MAPPLATLVAALADRYALERELGRGGMATVWLAEDLRHHRPVALKVLHPELASAVGAERFLREIRLAASFTHPHILPLLDSGEVGGLLYYAMPYVAGETLRARLARERQLPVADALAIATDVARALAYAHGLGVVHRDIKPENILLEGDEAVVADFGIARAVSRAAGDVVTSTGLVLGTPAYMSPEQASGDPALDGRSDLFSLGCVLYEMLAGEPPFAGPTAQVIAARRIAGVVPPLAPVRPDVPPEVERLVGRALARVPAARFRDAGEMLAALERAARGEFSETGAPLERTAEAPGLRRPSAPSGARGRARRRRVLAGLVLAALAAVVAFVLLRPARRAALDPSLVAVAPFDAIGPGLGLWREGVVDLLARDLDGAGPLRTVSPTVVVRRWTGRADPTSAAALGRRTGAGLVVFGSVTPSGADSVRLRASLLDAGRGQVLQEIELRDGADRIDRVTDSLTLALLRELGRTRPIGAWRRVGLSTTSLPALKAFLQGEQWLRRIQWDSAAAAYERAIAADSDFALALWRAGLVRGWTRTGFDSLSTALGVRASAHNHGLPPRDSLLIVGDSLTASLFEAGPMARGADAGWWGRARRARTTYELLARRYPDDPEVWYSTGDFLTHIGPFLGIPIAEARAAFDRAIALDSTFGPAYIHPVEFAFRDGAAAAERYLRPYLALGSTDVDAADMRLVERLLAARREGRAARDALLDSATTEQLFGAQNALAWWPDDEETVVHVRAALAARPPLPEFADPQLARGIYVLALVGRGHLRAARRAGTGFTPAPVPYNELALLDAIPPEAAAAHYRALLAAGAFQPIAGALAWWEAHGDTAAIAVAARRAGAAVRRPDGDPVEQQRAKYVAEAGAGYLALARRDTALALRRLLALPDSLCPACYLERLTRVQLLVAQGREREAAGPLRAELPTASLTAFPLTVLWTLLRARVAERLGDRRTASDSYGWVAAMWRDADPELQPYVAEARAGLARLAAERP
ncbi:MAG TPA: serine/threonine-protein kinase [Gemmatimonadales bacterium]|nr:serine/threonine-protein kinase [Gemmatimonadales bacterium]